jgi:hypothetical protein
MRPAPGDVVHCTARSPSDVSMHVVVVTQITVHTQSLGLWRTLTGRTLLVGASAGGGHGSRVPT